MTKRLILIFAFITINVAFSYGQKIKYDSTYSEFSGIVYLDSIVVSASRNGFNIEDFIKMVKNDKSFYHAFKNLRFIEYDFNNSLSFFDNKRKVIADYKSLNHQYFKNNCRWMQVNIATKKQGSITKTNKEYKYYTAKLYDRLFYTHDTICNQDTSTTLKLINKNSSKMEKYILELKKLIFTPGQKTNIPLIGDKTEIFSKKMRKYYNFSISHINYNDSIPCYVFTASLKPNLSIYQADNTVLRYLKTYFTKTDLQIIKKEYHLKHSTIAYDFDVKMSIKLKKILNKYYPTYIDYKGNWHVLLKKRERCNFSISMSNFNF